MVCFSLEHSIMMFDSQFSRLTDINRNEIYAEWK